MPRKMNNRRRRRTRKPSTKTSVQKKFQLRRPNNRVVRSLAPIAETKKYTGWTGTAPLGITSDYLPINSTYKLFYPYSFMNMQNVTDMPAGNNSFSAIEGRSLFSKYLSMNIEITYPHGENSPSEPVEPVEIIWGFCEPLNLTPFSTPTESSVSRTDIVNHINRQIQEDFDSSDDTMFFKEKRRRHYNIVGRRKIRPNKNAMIPQSIPSGSWSNSAAPLQTKISWKTNKKLRCVRSADSQASPGTQIPFVYPNQAYIPFCLIYNKSYDKYSANVVDPDPTKPITVKQITYRHHDCHWFNDM